MGRKLAVLLFVLCGYTQLQAPPSNLNLPESFFTPGEPVLIPSSDKYDPACTSKSEYDFCLFLKNPVAQQSLPVASADLQNLRRFGVKLKGLGPGGRLENQWLQILTLNSEGLFLKDLTLLKSAIADDESYVEQLSAYYWANRALEYLKGRVGSDRLPLSRLKIYVDDAFTGYASTKNSIHLEKSPSATARAFSGEAVIQLLGQALAQDLSRRALFPGAAAQHKSCSLSPRGCCATDAGCAQALGSAFDDRAGQGAMFGFVEFFSWLAGTDNKTEQAEHGPF